MDRVVEDVRYTYRMKTTPPSTLRLTLSAFVLAFTFYLLPFTFTHAALLYLDPGTATYGVGDTFFMNVRVDNEGECINAATVDIRYPTQSLRAVDFSRGDSIFSLWAEEPTIDTENGHVHFAGGIPGGYCGRAQGDPSLSNIVGKIVFTVIDASALKAEVSFSADSSVYLNDGFGTESSLHTSGSSLTLQTTPTLSENEWLSEVREDTTPPDSFDVIIESTRGVFGGRYYAVFSTVDKQSGLSHFEILERGVWTEAKSPHSLVDQSLADVQIRALDKAGNTRLGTFTPGIAPPRQGIAWDLPSILVALLALIVVAGVIVYLERRKHVSDALPPTQ